MSYSRYIFSSFTKVGTKTAEKSIRNRSIAREHVQSIIRINNFLSERDNQLFVCGIRDFISRDMAVYFQQIDDPSYSDVKCWTNGYMGERWFMSKKDVLEADTDFLISEFYKSVDPRTALYWFIEFFQTVGFDYKNEIFDKEVGYQMYEIDNNNHLLLYRLDRLDDMLGHYKIFSRVRGNVNVGANKWYAEKYKDFKNKITFDDDYIEQKIDNDIMRFFYTEGEIDDLIKRYGFKK